MPEPRSTRLALGLTLLPFAVSALVLIFVVRDSYLPISDHALTELHVRDIGHHATLIGLYSREDWSHPGPMLFYILAPFYWLTGGASIALNLGALAINAASITGIALIARGPCRCEAVARRGSAGGSRRRADRLGLFVDGQRHNRAARRHAAASGRKGGRGAAARNSRRARARAQQQERPGGRLRRAEPPGPVVLASHRAATGAARLRRA